MNIVAKKGNYVGVVFSNKEFSKIFENVEELNAYQLITFVENIIVPFFDDSDTSKYKKLSSFSINNNYKIVILNAIDSGLSRQNTIDDILLKMKNHEYSGSLSFNKSIDVKLLEEVSKSSASEIRCSLLSENEICIDIRSFGIIAIIEENEECSTIFKAMLNKMKSLNETGEQNEGAEEINNDSDEEDDDNEDEENSDEYAELDKLVDKYKNSYHDFNNREDPKPEEKSGNGFLYAKIQLKDIFIIKNSHILDDHRVDLLKRTVHGEVQYGIKIHCSEDNTVMLQVMDFIRLIKESLQWEVETEDILKKI